MKLAILLLAGLLAIHATGCNRMDEPEANVRPEDTRTDEERLRDMAAWMGEYWTERIERFERENPGEAPGGTVLLGDSLTELYPVEKFFEPGEVIRRGIGGDFIAGVRARLSVSLWDLEPERVFLMVGINNLIHTTGSQADLEASYRALFEEIAARRGDMTVHLQSLLPAEGHYAPYNDAIREANRRLEAMAGEYGFEWVDLYSVFVNEEGELRRAYSLDGLHLTEEGYAAWTGVIRPMIGNE